ncbi:hypothetical protein PYCC9005_000406 [Savitreella phatthalungensis]
MSVRPLPRTAGRPRLDTLGPIGFGAGVFSGVYNAEKPAPSELVSRAFELGIRHFDTSPYYGESEKLLGQAIRDLVNEPTANATREDLFIVTKAGRYDAWHLDYSPSRIRQSVMRSLDLLGLTYLDAVLLHDVEFVTEAETVNAARALFALKDEGLVRHVGISCYPVDVLVRMSCAVRDAMAGRPLDLVMSYARYTLHDASLLLALDDLRAAGVNHILSASPLAMGLLTSNGPPSWHPASTPLKSAAIRASHAVSKTPVPKILDTDPIDLPDVANGWVLRNAGSTGLGTTVVGFGFVREIEAAVRLFWEVSAIGPGSPGTRTFGRARTRHLHPPQQPDHIVPTLTPESSAEDLQQIDNTEDAAIAYRLSCERAAVDAIGEECLGEGWVQPPPFVDDERPSEDELRWVIDRLRSSTGNQAVPHHHRHLSHHFEKVIRDGDQTQLVQPLATV